MYVLSDHKNLNVNFQSHWSALCKTGFQIVDIFKILGVLGETNCANSSKSMQDSEFSAFSTNSNIDAGTVEATVRAGKWKFVI